MWALPRDVSTAMPDVDSQREIFNSRDWPQPQCEKYEVKGEFWNAMRKLHDSGDCKRMKPLWHCWLDMQTTSSITDALKQMTGPSNEEWARSGPKVQSCSLRLASSRHNWQRDRHTAKWRDANARKHPRWSSRKKKGTLLMLTPDDLARRTAINKLQWEELRSRVFEHLEKLAVGRQASMKRSSCSRGRRSR